MKHNKIGWMEHKALKIETVLISHCIIDLGPIALAHVISPMFGLAIDTRKVSKNISEIAGAFYRTDAIRVSRPTL